VRPPKPLVKTVMTPELRQLMGDSLSPVNFDLDEFKADFKRKNGIKYTVRDLALAGLSVAVAFLGVWVVYFAFGGK